MALVCGLAVNVGKRRRCGEHIRATLGCVTAASGARLVIVVVVVEASVAVAVVSGLVMKVVV